MKVVKFDALLAELKKAKINGTLKQTNYGLLIIELGSNYPMDTFKTVLNICENIVDIHPDDYFICNQVTKNKFLIEYSLNI